MKSLPDRYFWVVVRPQGDLVWGYKTSRHSPKLYITEGNAKAQLPKDGKVVRVKLFACPENTDWLPY